MNKRIARKVQRLTRYLGNNKVAAWHRRSTVMEAFRRVGLPSHMAMMMAIEQMRAPVQCLTEKLREMGVLN